MNEVKQIKTVAELIRLWPALFKLAAVGHTKAEHLLKVFLVCMDNGAVFAVRNFGDLQGSCCVEIVGDFAYLHSIPKDNGARLGKVCVDEVVKWAKQQKLAGIKVTTTKLCGSSFRYFEKSLGFRRRAVTFVKEI